MSQVTPEVAITTTAPEPSEEIDLQVDAKLGGFTSEEIEKIKSGGATMNIKESASATETSTASSPDEEAIEVSRPLTHASSSNDGSGGGAGVSQTIHMRRRWRLEGVSCEVIRRL